MDGKRPDTIRWWHTNLYGYVLGDPVGGVDALGLWAVIGVYNNPLFYTNSGGWFIIGITTIGIVGYEVYKHWDDFDDYCWKFASKGNVADTAITQVWQSEGGRGKNKCDWLKENAYRWLRTQVKRTEKAWKCRHSRQSKDRKNR
jgi:hypothetical protein